MESSAFARLHRKLQHWIWRTGWSELRDIQEQAIPAILAKDRDVLIAAATAGGKTEAAMLPILSTLVDDAGGSLRVLHVSPLRALINDQFRRLELLCEELQIPVHRWHGDVGAAHKRRVRTDPAGVLLITPESLEALFVLRGHEIGRLFSRLDFVVIDELHVFLGSERGAQLQSLLHRLELTLRRRVLRVGLSATLGDLALASKFLRPGGGEATLVESVAAGQELRIQLRGYLRAPPPKPARAVAGQAKTDEEEEDGASAAMVRHLFEHLRGGHHLIFANTRARVEELADRLAGHCHRENLPNTFWPHHGSLSKDLREDAETALKDLTRPASVVCTSTLELGIDIGNIQSVAQVGRPPAVASLRQRLGRSGRAGEPSILRCYVEEAALDPRSPPHETLRSDLVQVAAMIELLLVKWCEPPELRSLHLSTLVQQLLSVIAQHGSVRADEAFRALCGGGPFSRVDERLFGRFLRSLAKSGLIAQERAGDLVLAEKGDRLVDHYSFYASFASPEEYRVTAGGRQLGSAPFTESLFPGRQVIFGGRRWVVEAVDERAKVVDLKPAAGGRPPRFEGGGTAPVHDRVRKEMRRLYQTAESPRYLDAGARELLRQGQEQFRRFDLDRRQLLRHGADTLFFPWAGDRAMDTLSLWLAVEGVEARVEGLALVFEGGTPESVASVLNRMADAAPPDSLELAARVENRDREKFHPWLEGEVLAADYAAGVLDLEGAQEILQKWQVQASLS